MTTPSDSALLELATALEAQRAAAVRANDAAALGALLSAELRYVHSSGKPESRESLLAKVTGGELEYRKFDSTIERVVSLGEDAFVAFGAVQLEAVLGGQLRSVDAVFFLAWRREGDTWRLVGLQNTSV